jgi:asparagine synthase (glutamine-hydrolysing)
VCGIAGIWDPSGKLDATASAKQMLDAIVHRGPDGEGLWRHDDLNLVLGHRRLAIVDLSETGRQPMQSAGQRFTVTFNGEIYNFLKLRRELEGRGVLFRGQSDTEVLLAAFEVWGVREAVDRCIGMFALAVWDANRRSLTLVRDRFGEKPLYYSLDGGRLVFASELKAMMALPSFERKIDRRVLRLFLRHNYVPSPHSIFQGTHKLSPGTMLEIAADGSGALRTDEETYWSPTIAAVRAAE